jgi:sugar O-acyltransferase (sialic acid O-acetyltransferase NeuD family)
MKKLAILGSGDLAIQITHLAQLIGNHTVIGYFDDFKTRGEMVGTAPILGAIADVIDSFQSKMFDELVIGIGYKHMEKRAALYEHFAPKIPFARIIHPSCIVDPSAKIAQGCILYSGCVLDMNVFIDANCLLYNGCILAHDSQVEKGCIFSPSVNIAGFCKIGPLVNLGIGTTVSDSISITEKVQTGAGTVVVQPITESGLYVGVPAKKIK